ncbi:MAG: hypothetical protein JW839_05390 [Candidatus Lokiarchaeota archaeon]|nr:hypothetical protein [Candidatus Lokiarchaeota archaeon]
MLEIIPYDVGATPFVVFIGSIAVLASFLFIKILVKYLRGKTRITLYMALNVFFWLFGSAGYFIGLLSWYFEDDRGIMFRLSLPLGYSAIVIATFFSLLFSGEFMKQPDRKRRIYAALYAIYMVALVASLFNFDANKWGALPPIPAYRLVNLILVILGNIIVFSILASQSHKLLALVSEPVYKATLRFVYYFFVFMILCFVLMVASEVHLMLLDDPPIYGPIEYVAWVCGFLGLISGYVGLTQPGWFKKRFLKETEHSG